MSLTIGLDRKSPVPLESNPRRYEGLIERHGQWVRWSVAKKCTCLLVNNRPDASCDLCRGSGWRYSFQNTEEDIDVSGVALDARTIEMPYVIDKRRIASVRNAQGVRIPISGIFGKWIKTAIDIQPRSSFLVSVVNPRKKIVPETAAVYIGHGVVKLDEYEYQNPWAKVPYDLTSVTSLRQADGTELTVTAFSVDSVLIDTSVIEPAVGERLVITAEYMPPFRIAILNQNLSEMDRSFLQDAGGDSMAVFPFSYKVSEYDTITLWVGQQVRKKVIKRSVVDDIDFLPDLFVSQILSLADASVEYVEGTDFVLWDRNTIRWLEGGARPDDGKLFSIEYMANATYRVLPQLPNIRSSEDKRFPSRVALKLEAGTTGSDPV